MRAVSAFSAVVILTLSAAKGQDHSPRLDRTVWDSVYSTTQAARGESLYVKGCARCHRASLSGGDESPPLAGSSFVSNWTGSTLSDLETRIRTTMPSDSVGIYDRKVVTDIIAYLLKSNAFPAGTSDLSSEAEALGGVTIRVAKP